MTDFKSLIDEEIQMLKDETDKYEKIRIDINKHNQEVFLGGLKDKYDENRIQPLLCKFKELQKCNPSFYINYDSLISLDYEQLESKYQEVKSIIETCNKQKLLYMFKCLRVNSPHLNINIDESLDFETLESHYNQTLNVIQNYSKAQKLKSEHPELSIEEIFKVILDQENLQKLKLYNEMLPDDFSKISYNELIERIIKRIQTNDNITTRIINAFLHGGINGDYKNFNFISELEISAEQKINMISKLVMIYTAVIKLINTNSVGYKNMFYNFIIKISDENSLVDIDNKSFIILLSKLNEDL